MSPHDSENAHAWLVEYLCSEPLRNLVLVGLVPDCFAGPVFKDVEVSRCETLEAAEQKQALRDQEESVISQTALVCNIDAADCNVERSLGRASRAFPHRVLVCCKETDPASSRFSPKPNDSVFFALGFVRLNQCSPSASTSESGRWYEYRMTQYKSVPDWLNSKYWANPERFNIYDENDEEGGLLV